MGRSRLNLEPWQRTLVIMFAAQLLSAVGFSLIFPFLPLYVQELGSTTGQPIELWVGLVFSAQALTMAIASPIWGALADRLGRKLMVQRAMFGGAIILCLMAFARSAEQLVLLRTIQGFITGTIAASNALVASLAPRERVGSAMGVLQVGLWSGMAIGPLVGGVLADLWGFRAPFLITSVLLAIAGLVVWRGVDEQFQPATDSSGRRPSFVAGWKHVLSAPGVILAYAMRFLSLVGQRMVLPIAPLFVQTLLADPARLGTLTGLVVGISSATSTIGALSLGRRGDQIGHRRILVISSIAAALFYFPQSLVTNVWQLLVLQALTGLAIGGIIPSLSALLARYSQRGEEGAVFGLDNSVVAAARAVAPMAGAFFVYWFDVRSAFVAAAIALLLTAAMAYLGLPKPEVSREPSVGPV